MKSFYFKITLCLVLSGILFTRQLQAQQTRIFNTENSGLPHNWVTAIAIDAHGNKWFGTVNGELVKYDDVNWTVYNISNGLSITTIAIDQQDNKWLGTEDYVFPDPGELIKFDNTGRTVYNSSNSGFPNTRVSAITFDSLGNTWIGTWGAGVLKFDGTKWTAYDNTNTSLSDNNIRSVAIDKMGNKWIATGSEISKFNDTNWTTYSYSKSIIPYYNGNGGINSIAFDKTGNKWFGVGGDWNIGAAGGVAEFDDVNWTLYDSSNSGLLYGVYSIAIDVQGNKWFVCNDGLHGAFAEFDGTTWTVYNSENSGFPDGTIESLVIDDKGNKWFTTWNSGVVKFNENGITTGINGNISVRSDNFTVYPNPAKDLISINGLSMGMVQVFNSSGQIVKSFQIERMQSKMDISNLVDGIYTVRVTTVDGVAAQKLLKINNYLTQ